MHDCATCAGSRDGRFTLSNDAPPPHCNSCFGLKWEFGWRNADTCRIRIKRLLPQTSLFTVLIKLLIKGSKKASKPCVKVSFYLLAHTLLLSAF